MTKLKLAVVLVNIRSVHNVGSILRTASFFGCEEAIFVGVTPHPELPEDSRLPHIKLKLSSQIDKVALGASQHLKLSYFKDLESAVGRLRSDGYQIVGLEQDPDSEPLDKFKPTGKNYSVALLIGEETKGLSSAELSLADQIIEIPRLGRKESLNVSVAAAVAIYALSS